MDPGVLDRNNRLAAVLPRQQENLALNQIGRLGASQREVLLGTVIQILVVLGFGVYLIQGGSLQPRMLSLGLVGLGGLLVLIYLLAPHWLISVRHAEGRLHVNTPEQTPELQLLDQKSGKIILRLSGAAAPPVMAFAEGTPYRFHYLHIPGARSGHYDAFLSAEALPEVAN